MVLEQYPSEVIIYISDPRTGVQRHCKWPPTISEIVEACDNRIAELKRNERYRNWGKNEPLMLEAPQENRPTLQELKAKYGENWGLGNVDKDSKPQPKQAPSWDKIAEMYKADPNRLRRLIHAADDQHPYDEPTPQMEPR